MSEDLAAAHSRVQPAWLKDLVNLAKTDFPRKAHHDDPIKILCEKTSEFILQLPLCVLNVASMAIPTVYPLRGTVVQAKDHFYSDKADQAYAFPPDGMVLQVAVYKFPVPEDEVGKLERENLDLIFLAWLMKYQEVKEDQRAKALFLKASQRVLMSFRLRADVSEKLAKAYQLKEDEEKNATIAGHSLLSRARELNAIQDEAWEGLGRVRSF